MANCLIVEGGSVTGLRTSNGTVYTFNVPISQLKNRDFIAAFERDPIKALQKANVKIDGLSQNNIVSSEFTNHSGGAIGSDTEWDNIGREFGMVNNKHYWTETKTPNGNTEITQEEFEEGRFESAKAAKRNFGYQYSTMKDSRLIRNWSQVKNSDAIFAIGKIVKTGEKIFPNQANDTRVAQVPSVTGGTGYAVGMGINKNKPVFVFNQTKGSYDIGWYKWDATVNDFVKTETPKLTKDFAGIGTREINDAGKKAIRDVYVNTFNNTQETNAADAIYKKLGNKTKSGNIIIKPWVELKDATKAITTEGIISTRIKNSNEHFGNPFSSNVDGLIKTENTKESVEKYINWVLYGETESYLNPYDDFSKFAKSYKPIFKIDTDNLIDIDFKKGSAIANRGVYSKIIGLSEWRLTPDSNSYYKIDNFNELLEKEKRFRHVNTILLDGNLNLDLAKEYIDLSEYLSKAFIKIIKDNFDVQLDLKTSQLHANDKYIESQRREWIREQLKSGNLKNKPVIYYKELGEPSHATALDYLINRYNWNENTQETNANSSLVLDDSSEIETKQLEDFNNQNEFYRVIVGDESFNDIVNTGVVRTNSTAKKVEKTEGINLGGRPTLWPSFSKGKASISYAQSNDNNYIISTDDASIKESKMGRHGRGTTMFPTDENGNPVTELSGDKVKVYKHVGNDKYMLVYDKGKVVSNNTNFSKFNTETNPTQDFKDLIQSLSDKLGIPVRYDNNLPYAGAFIDGNVVLNPSKMDETTVWHEFAHPFVQAVRKQNKPLYDNLVNEIYNTPHGKALLKEVQSLYGEKNQKIQEEEVIVELIARYATGKVNEEYSGKEYESLWTKIANFIKEIGSTIVEFATDIAKTINPLWFEKGKSFNIFDLNQDMNIKQMSEILKYGGVIYQSGNDIGYKKIKNLREIDTELDLLLDKAYLIDDDIQKYSSLIKYPPRINKDSLYDSLKENVSDIFSESRLDDVLKDKNKYLPIIIKLGESFDKENTTIEELNDSLGIQLFVGNNTKSIPWFLMMLEKLAYNKQTYQEKLEIAKNDLKIETRKIREFISTEVFKQQDDALFFMSEDFAENQIPIFEEVLKMPYSENAKKTFLQKDMWNLFKAKSNGYPNYELGIELSNYMLENPIDSESLLAILKTTEQEWDSNYAFDMNVFINTLYVKSMPDKLKNQFLIDESEDFIYDYRWSTHYFLKNILNLISDSQEDLFDYNNQENNINFTFFEFIKELGYIQRQQKHVDLISKFLSIPKTNVRTVGELGGVFHNIGAYMNNAGISSVDEAIDNFVNLFNNDKKIELAAWDNLGEPYKKGNVKLEFKKESPVKLSYVSDAHTVLSDPDSEGYRERYSITDRDLNVDLKRNNSKYTESIIKVHRNNIENIILINSQEITTSLKKLSDITGAPVVKELRSFEMKAKILSEIANLNKEIIALNRGLQALYKSKYASKEEIKDYEDSILEKEKEIESYKRNNLSTLEKNNLADLKKELLEIDKRTYHYEEDMQDAKNKIEKQIFKLEYNPVNNYETIYTPENKVEYQPEIYESRFDNKNLKTESLKSILSDYGVSYDSFSPQLKSQIETKLTNNPELLNDSNFIKSLTC